MFTTWVMASDLHGDKQDRQAINALKRFVDDFKPKIRLFAGDLWDVRAWRRGASESEKRERMRRDFDKGMEFLDWFKPEAICLGNHDVRIWDQVAIGGPFADLAAIFIQEFAKTARKLKCRVLPYDKRKGIYHRGKLKMAHGFFDGTTAARQMAQAFGSILFGHGHSIDVASVASDHRRAARMIGCLCRLDFEYNRAHVNALRQAHGWAYGPLFANGSYQAFQAEMIGNKVVVAENIKVISV